MLFSPVSGDFCSPSILGSPGNHSQHSLPFDIILPDRLIRLWLTVKRDGRIVTLNPDKEMRFHSFSLCTYHVTSIFDTGDFCSPGILGSPGAVISGASSWFNHYEPSYWIEVDIRCHKLWCISPHDVHILSLNPDKFPLCALFVISAPLVRICSPGVIIPTARFLSI